MTRRLFVILTATLTALAAAWVDARQDPTFRTRTHSVSLYATVVDRTGRLVPDLSRADFDVFDNGVRQPLTVFANDLQPITIVIMLDRSGSMAGNFDLERDAAEQFVDHLLPADKARLGSFSNRVQIDPPEFTSDKPELVRILHENLQDAGPTPLWNATSAAMTALARHDGRKVVLVFTDGADNPFRAGENVSLGEIRNRALAEEIMVYAIGLTDDCARFEAAADAGPSFQVRGRPPTGRGAPPPPPPVRLPGRVPPGILLPPGDGRIGRGRPDPGGELLPPRRGSGADLPCSNTKPDAGLRTLADEGGGGYFELQRTGDLSAAFARVADELHRQYLLGFTPAALDGKVHMLDVRVRRPDLTARARKSYLAAAGK
jgi:VWFA-related protein